MMSDQGISVAHQRLSARLRQFFGETFEYSDKNPSEFYTRALVGLFFVNEVGVKPSQIRKFVIDGKNDSQVDGVHYDRTEKVLYFVQSKFKSDPNDGLSLADATKFLSGVETLINGSAKNANAKLSKLLPDIEDAVTDFETRVVLTIVTNSNRPIAPEIYDHIKSFIERKNEGVEDIFSFSFFNISEMYNLARYGPGARSIDLEFELTGVGHVRAPYSAYYGAISGKTLKQWYKKHEKKILKDNVRFFLFETDVNNAIRDTVYKTPENFWYFNNGITAIAKEVRASAKGVSADGPTALKATSVSIVNGAQTLGTLGNIEDEDKLEEIRVPFRIISLEDSPPQFEELVTRATNTQNDLQAADFVSLDPIHDTIRSQLAAKGINYNYRRGDVAQDKKDSFDLREATVALACSLDDLTHAVQAKRYFSGLLKSTESEPYTLIFNAKTDPDEVWNNVRIYRLIEQVGKELSIGADSLFKQIIVHSDKFVAHLIFATLRRDSISTNKFLELANEMKSKSLISFAVVETSNALGKGMFKETYPGNIFKSLDMQEKLKIEILPVLKGI